MWPRPKLGDPAHRARGLQPERDGRLHCSAFVRPSRSHALPRTARIRVFPFSPAVWVSVLPLKVTVSESRRILFIVHHAFDNFQQVFWLRQAERLRPQTRRVVANEQHVRVVMFVLHV